MKHYTDEDVSRATDAIRFAMGSSIVGNRQEAYAKAVLEIIAPAIAARALREAAEAMEGASPSSTFAPGWTAARLGLLARAAADEIEGS